jgi:hypothetical protein
LISCYFAKYRISYIGADGTDEVELMFFDRRTGKELRASALVYKLGGLYKLLTMKPA